MPHQSLKIKPGLNTNRTITLNEAGISDSDNIRFVFDREGLGLAQKLGGWAKYVLNYSFTGVIRALHVWQDLNNTQWLGIGTDGSQSGLLAYNGTTNPNTTTPIDVTPNTSSEPFLASTLLGTITGVSATGNGTTATLSFSPVANGLIITVGETVTVAGLGAYNGNVIVTASTSSTISYLSSAGGTPSGGTITATAGSNYGFSTNGASSVASTRATLTVFSTTSHTVGDVVVYPSYVNVGNLLLSGPYQVISVGASPTTYTISVGASSSITTLVRTTNVVTITLPYIHNYYGGETITIFGTTTGGAAFDGNFTINAASITPYGFTYNQTAADSTATGGFITPNITTGGTPPLFTTTTNQASITVTLYNHGFSVGGSFFIPFPTTVGGITLSGIYTVVSVIADPTNTNYSNGFTINAPITASSSVSVYETYGSVGQTFYISRVPNFTGNNILYGGWTVLATSPAITSGYISGTTLTLTSAASGPGLISVSLGLTGAGVLADTLIISGTYPTYTVNQSQTVGSVGSPITLTVFNLSGLYGADLYGTGGVIVGTVGSQLATTDWTLDNWGQIFISCPEGGAIFYWQPVGSPVLNSAIIPNAPLVNRGIFIAMPQRQIIAYGSSTAFYQDPLLVRWCDIQDFTTWIGTAYNQAGQYRIPTGSMIMGGMQVAQQGLLWTDLDLWAMQYIGAPLVYGFNKIGSNCGLIGKKAAGQLGGAVYWMSQNQFFRLAGGGVEPIPCSIRDWIFQNLYDANASRIRCATNTHFNEVVWHFPAVRIPVVDEEGLPTGAYIIGNGENNAYARYNVLLNAWDYGYQMPSNVIATGVGSIAGNTLSLTSVSSGSFGNGNTLAGGTITAGTKITGYLTGTGGAGTYSVSISQNVSSTVMTGTVLATDSLISRTAWFDQSVLGNPIGAATTSSVPSVGSPVSSIYQHEVTFNADGAPLKPYFKTGYFALAEGDNKVFIDQIWPDMKWSTIGGEVYYIATNGVTANGTTATAIFTQPVTIPIGTSITIQGNSLSTINASFTVTASSAGSVSFATTANGTGTGGTLGLSNNSKVSMTFYMANYPTDIPTQYGPYTISATVNYLSVRMRGRLMQIAVSSDDSNGWWRIGNTRYRYAPDGKY